MTQEITFVESDQPIQYLGGGSFVVRMPDTGDYDQQREHLHRYVQPSQLRFHSEEMRLSIVSEITSETFAHIAIHRWAMVGEMGIIISYPDHYAEVVDELNEWVSYDPDGAVYSEKTVDELKRLKFLIEVCDKPHYVLIRHPIDRMR